MSEWRPKPGIYYGESWAKYLSCPYLSPSKLKHGLRSMRRLKRAIDGDIAPPSEKTTAVGNAVHCLIAGEDQERIAVMPAFEKSEKNLTKGTIKTPPKSMKKKDGSFTAAGQKWKDLCEENGLQYDFAGEISVGHKKTESKNTDFYREAVFQFEIANEGKTVITEIQDATARKVVSNIWSNKNCADIIKRSEKEVTVIACVDGVMVKTRMDMLDVRSGHGADLKTTTDIEPKAFYRKCRDLNYFFQFGCHNLFLANAGDSGIQLQSYDVIAAETGDDYDVGLIHIMPFELLDKWSDRARDVINSYSLAKATGSWLGLYPSPAVISIPNWDMTDDEDVDMKELSSSQHETEVAF